MTTMKSGDKSWADYYQSLAAQQNFYPENFVTRVFLSKSPVKFLSGSYQDKHILDLGCGHGRHIPFLLNNGLNVSGLEVSEEQVELLAKTFPNLSFKQGTADNLPYDADSFDFVLACNSIYYLSKEQDSVKSHFEQIKHVLKPGGYAIFSMLGSEHTIFDDATKVNDNGVYLIKNDFLKFREGIKVQCYQPEAAKDIFAGLTIEHVGEVIEKVSGTARHFYYFVAKG